MVGEELATEVLEATDGSWRHCHPTPSAALAVKHGEDESDAQGDRAAASGAVAGLEGQDPWVPGLRSTHGLIASPGARSGAQGPGEADEPCGPRHTS